jgi:hypothetical protein
VGKKTKPELPLPVLAAKFKLRYVDGRIGYRPKDGT